MAKLRTAVLGGLLLPMLVPLLGRPVEIAELSQATLRGKVLFLRHALAPGGGDPPQFELERCDTQRQLDQEGRDQAESLGRRFRARNLSFAAVYSSKWCRCLETARRLGDVGAGDAVRA